ncbi:thiamine pyrophosphate-binding protein [Saliphagus sp. GCM10025308]
MTQRVADQVSEYFERRGVEYYFGYHGGSVWPLLDGLRDCSAEGIQVKHEAQAAHMADGYFRVSGKIAPVVVTKGPGALNALPGVANLIHDSTATVVVSGGVSTQHKGKLAFEALDYHNQEGLLDVYEEVTKRTWNGYRPDTAVDFLDRAFKTALEGRPGPTAIVLPYDVQNTEVEVNVPDPADSRADSRPEPAAESLSKAADVLAEADRPLAIAGGGVRLSGGTNEFIDLVEAFEIPFVTTHMGKGAFPEDHDLCLGPVGRSGWECSLQATRDTDVILAIGCRFSDGNTMGYEKGAVYNVPPTKVIHADIDSNEIGKSVPVEVGIVSDATSFAEQFRDRLAADGVKTVGTDDWREQTATWKADWDGWVAETTSHEGSPVHPHRLVHDTKETMADDDLLFVDVGDVIQYAEPFARVYEEDTYFFNGGMLQMGWGAGAVLGGKLAAPDREAVCLVGDGALTQNMSVIPLAVEHDIPVTWVLLNNYGPNIERKGQRNIWGEAHEWGSFGNEDDLYNPDWVAFAESCGAAGRRVERSEEVASAVREGLDSDVPFLVDAVIDRDVPTYFTPGLEHNYPTSWTESADYL